MVIEFASLPGEFATVGKLIPCRKGMHRGSWIMPGLQAPTMAELLSNPVVQRALERHRRTERQDPGQAV
jgi:hypothetical protein